MRKYALINEESVVMDLLEVENIETLDGYVLPEHQCALINITHTEAPLLGQIYNHNTNQFE
jgi:hypothetical protein